MLRRSRSTAQAGRVARGAFAPVGSVVRLERGNESPAMKEHTVHTRHKREMVDITNQIATVVSHAGQKDGIATVFVTHTTAAITTADLDPGGTDQDYLDAFDRMVPKLSYRHPHDPSHMPDHILASLIGASLAVPFRGGELILGTWQRIVLVELDGPRDRRVIVSV